MKEEIGTYRKNQKGFGFVKLEGQEEEIYISKENSYNALKPSTILFISCLELMFCSSIYSLATNSAFIIASFSKNTLTA